MDRNWIIRSAPAVEPVTLEEQKAWSAVDGTAHDGLLSDLIKATRELAELYTGRAFISQGWTLHAAQFDDTRPLIKIPLPPLISVDEVRAIGRDGTATAIDPTGYMVLGQGDYGELILTDSNPERLEVDFVAGYGAAAGDVPAALRLAIKAWANAAYESRVPSAKPPEAVAGLLDPFRAVHA